MGNDLDICVGRGLLQTTLLNNNIFILFSLPQPIFSLKWCFENRLSLHCFK